ncbi:hypothetical protein U9M48_026227 [Paspalum notatum var. saurae]|uniref:Uncharacterized protein n=1 Tax=Paspalum notatum var. saurae TaxID=547442 RepID=A0AAQ3TUV3_PASNO
MYTEFPEVISVEPSRTYTTATTRSWDFLGLSYQMPNNLLHKARYGEDIIIGVIDTGIWPELRSFNDKGYGPVLLGFNFVRLKPAVTAYGLNIRYMDLFSLSPSFPPTCAIKVERLVQVGQDWNLSNCNRKIIGARFYTTGFDAIHDGVDVLSMSIDQPGENSFGALHAVQKGIAIVPQTVVNAAPWVITVAASKIDRSFPTVIALGNKQQIVGQSLCYQEKNSSSRSIFRSLAFGDLCTKDNIQNAGGSGIIYAQYTTDTLEGTATCNGIACVLVDLDTGNKIVEYMSATSSPVAKIEPARTFTSKELLAPKVAAFSARGPSIYYADIIKPDIAAPGASILAAKGNSYVTGSGTSMATPHVAGTVALLKALHLEWSPAALKSAIITSGGNINPNKAADPGLIYDIDPSEYNKYYGCAISRTTVSCNRTSVPGYHLNLPSISVPDLRHSISIPRMVTNVVDVDAVYHAAIQSPPGVKMDVEPSILVFNARNKFHTFHYKGTALLEASLGIVA